MKISPQAKPMLFSYFQRRWWLILGAFWLILGLAVEGCGRPRPTRKPKAKSSSTSKDASDAKSKDASDTKASDQPSTSQLDLSLVRLRQVNKSSFDAWLQRQKGKVVLVDFWASWCMPCRELFPHTVQLHRQWASQGLVVAAVSLDDPEAETEVRQFLAKQGADFENFIAAGPPEPVEAFQITGGSLPHFKIYGPDGRLLRTLASAQQNIEPADLEKAVQEALAALKSAGQVK